MWNKFSSLFMKSSINGNDRKFYENCLNIISDIRIKYGLKGIQVKEIEELFSGVKYIEFKEQIPREIYEKNKKQALMDELKKDGMDYAVAKQILEEGRRRVKERAELNLYKLDAETEVE